MTKTVLKCVICGAEYTVNRSGTRGMTCSEECHQTMKRILISHHGRYEKVVNHAGEAFRVPTEDIIEFGIKEEELGKYPRWEDSLKEGGP